MKRRENISKKKRQNHSIKEISARRPPFSFGIFLFGASGQNKKEKNHKDIKMKRQFLSYIPRVKRRKREKYRFIKGKSS